MTRSHTRIYELNYLTSRTIFWSWRAVNYKNNGILNKFIGEGILAIFGQKNSKGAGSKGAVDALSCAF
ncbi:MAG: hypothetical protein ACR2KF_05225 [Nitrososphaeraceae archaeon]